VLKSFGNYRLFKKCSCIVLIDILASVTAITRRFVMSRRHLTFICQNCGAAFNRWQGKCEACGEWNTLSEEGEERPAGPGRKPGKGRLFAL
jgi:predicted amidophosphoribosyltransferase